MRCLIGFVVISLCLLSYTIGVAQDGDEILLEERFEEGKKDAWKVLEKDLGNDFIITKGALNAFGALNWQLKIPFSKEPPAGRQTGGILCEFRYRVAASKDDQSFVVGLGWEVEGENRIEPVAAVALNAANLAIEGDNENRGLPAEKGKWHSVRIVLDRIGDNTYDVYLNDSRVGLSIPILAKGETVNCVGMWTKPNKRGSLGDWFIDDLVVSVVPLAVEPFDRLATTWSKLKSGQSIR
jgi:hypothetical protein